MDLFVFKALTPYLKTMYIILDFGEFNLKTVLKMRCLPIQPS